MGRAALAPYVSDIDWDAAQRDVESAIRLQPEHAMAYKIRADLEQVGRPGLPPGLVSMLNTVDVGGG